MINMWIIIIAVFAGICLASLLYFRNKRQHYGKALTIILFTLRSITTSTIIILLFNPFIKIKSTVVEPATIILAQDNSKSLILTKDSLFYENKYPLIIDTLINELDEKFTIDKYIFGNEVREFDSIDYQDYYTNFHEALELFKKDYYKKNVGAVILLSDGISNNSYPPEQDIESYPFTIHTVTLGDTTTYPDICINDIFYNKTSPSNSVFPIRIVANAINCRNKNMEIEIFLNNEIAEEITVPINSNRFSKEMDFNLDLKEEGVKQIDVKIKPIEKEQITSNNGKRFFIEVIDKQYKALFYAKSPHPDLGSLKNILGNNFNIDIIFNNEEIPDLKNYDIVLLHQVPFLGMNNFSELKSKLSENKKTPIFYIIGESTDYEAFNNLQNSINISKGSVNSTIDTKAYFNHNFGLFNIDNEAIESINNFPPLSSHYIDCRFNTNHDIILKTKINDVETQTPLLSFCIDNESRKNAYLFGTGIWKWKLYDYYKENEYTNFEELLSKSVKYLLTNRKKELIVNHKENFIHNESINFTAELKNPSQELTTIPDLKINVTNKHTKDIYEYNFLKNDKTYSLNIGTLPEGFYDYTAKAQHGNNVYTDNGSFNVINIGIEEQDLTANSQRMQLLASLTGGTNIYVNEIKSLIEILDNDERITLISKEMTNYKDLINWKSIFFVILSLITIEWVLRKTFGTY